MTSDVLEQIASDPRRLVTMNTVHNFRDLGGYPTSDGRHTRWGTLYRADGLGRIGDTDLEIIRALGLRTVLDLRSLPEMETRGRFPHDRVEVNFTHFPIIDATWQEQDRPEFDADHDFLVWAYTDMLRVGHAQFALAIDELARPGALPAVFHCAAGKDRTGLLAALVLGSIDVPREVILADYALTAEGMVRLLAYAAREFPESAEQMAQTPSAFLAALPSSLDAVLDGLVAEHGSIRDYVTSIGVADETIERLTAALLTEA